jgi:phenylalanyl-tRNA synthetase beta chain
LNWLSKLLGENLDARDVSDRLAMLGAPVEAMEEVHADLSDVIVARVEAVAPHPNADRLRLCQVETGQGAVEVVCGAPNVTAGKKYPYARAGSTLPGGFKLEPRKIRGVVSNGMLCSARELGLGTDHEGILELQTDAQPGAPLRPVLGLDDVLLDVEVTPNRPDLLCHRGIARELGAVLGKPIKLEPIPGAPDDTLTPARVERVGTVDGLEVQIADLEGCRRFMIAVIRGVRVGPSPIWMQNRLRRIGQRPINNVVDVTNYILHELNQPMHAYDLARLAGPKLDVRAAKKGETVVTLDGQARALEPGMTLICDADGPTGIGGVMGGEASEVNEETTDVALECGYFDPATIRRTRKALKMSTEASYRFERGTDLLGMPAALRRGVAMIMATAGGREHAPPVDVYPKTVTMPTVFLRPERVAYLLGVEIPNAEIEKYLTSLGFAVAPRNGRLAVQAPGWRPDVSREEDLVEEIARLRGYDSFPVEMRPFRRSTVPDEPLEAVKARARRVMTALGLHEARSLSLTSQKGEHAPALMNPLSAEEGYLRSDLIPGLTRALERNWAERERDIRLFEIGVVFGEPGADGRPAETLRMAAVVTGGRRPRHWTDANSSVDFDLWDVKGLFGNAVDACGPPGTIQVHGDGWRLVDSNGTPRGWCGPVGADAPPWAGAVLGFELDIEDRGENDKRYRRLPQTPPVERDLALVLPAAKTAGRVEEVIRSEAGRYLESISVFDEFRGKDISGRSVAWRLTFRAPDRTLRDKEIDKTIEKVLKALEEQLGVTRRTT